MAEEERIIELSMDRAVLWFWEESEVADWMIWSGVEGRGLDWVVREE